MRREKPLFETDIVEGMTAIEPVNIVSPIDWIKAYRTNSPYLLGTFINIDIATKQKETGYRMARNGNLPDYLGVHSL